MYKQKRVLDCCCGSKMFWFDKNNPDVLFTDIREEKHVLCDKRELVISPDMVMDFRKLDLPSGHFKLVVFDPPHLKNVGRNSWMAKKYGMLGKNWEKDIKLGFDECWRVLDKDGVLIFKWSEKDIKVSQIIKIIGKNPLFGHKTMINNNTVWMCFMK